MTSGEHDPAEHARQSAQGLTFVWALNLVAMFALVSVFALSEVGGAIAVGEVDLLAAGAINASGMALIVLLIRGWADECIARGDAGRDSSGCGTPAAPRTVMPRAAHLDARCTQRRQGQADDPRETAPRRPQAPSGTRSDGTPGPAGASDERPAPPTRAARAAGFLPAHLGGAR